MGQLVYSMITSLDGYVADQGGQFEWAVPDEEVLDVINHEMNDVGAFLYGRHMYELMAVWETDPAAAAQSPRSADFAKIWQKTDKIVYSTTLTSVDTHRTRIKREFHPEEISDLKDSTTSMLTVDGPTLAAQALQHGLVDQLQVFVCPVALGGGLRLLPNFKIDMRLRGERRFSNGMIKLDYDIKPPA